MSHFLQLHLLTSYPPANLNRDDLGRPKTALMGGSQRLRVSSQSLKRAWRISDVFKNAVGGHIGTRTKELGRKKVYDPLIGKGVSPEMALKWSQAIGGVFGKLRGADKERPLQELEIEQLVHVSQEELAAVHALVEEIAKRGSGPSDDELKLLKKRHSSTDIALFGRMLASQVSYNVEGAAQVAHAITVHKVAVEDDYFTAVDDLNEREEDLGAAHVGESEFGAGLFYLYVCIDRELLEENLGGDADLAKKSIAGLVEAAATVAPTGKQNSFASRARASYILAEKGDQQPRGLSVAFLKPAKGPDMMASAISELQNTRENMDKAYGPCADQHYVMDAVKGEGSLRDLITFATD